MSSKGNNLLLSVIVPVYLGEKTVERDIRSIGASLMQLDVASELIVVVDGNEDKTLQKAKALESSRIHVVGYAHNKGKGYAVRFGMVRAKGSIIAFIDSGSDIKPDGLSMMLEHFRWYNADIIVGSKRHSVSKVNYPWQRKIISWGYQLLVKLLFGLSIRDTQVGIKLYRRTVVEDVFPRLLVKRFAFDIEMLAVAHHLGYTRIFEAPVELDFSGASTITSFRLWKEVFNVFWDTLAVFYRLRILHYYDTMNKRTWRYDPELNFRINLP